MEPTLDVEVFGPFRPRPADHRRGAAQTPFRPSLFPTPLSPDLDEIHIAEQSYALAAALYASYIML
jgi:hypothetical protein